MIIRFGYDRRALLAQAALLLFVLPATYLLTKPEDNVNWVYGPDNLQTVLSGPAYLMALMAVMGIGICVPMHLLLTNICPLHRGAHGKRSI